MKQILTKGKVVIAELGGDDAILKAMKLNQRLPIKPMKKWSMKHLQKPLSLFYRVDWQMNVGIGRG